MIVRPSATACCASPLRECEPSLPASNRGCLISLHVPTFSVLQRLREVWIKSTLPAIHALRSMRGM